MAGAVGFEPTVHEIKTRCLTTWLHPNYILDYIISIIFSSVLELLILFML